MTFDATRLTALRRVSAVRLSPDERWLAVVASELKDDESGYVSHIWRVDRAPQGAPRQLTAGAHGGSSPQFRSDGGLVFLSKRPGAPDAAGEPRPQVWLLPAGGGEARPLTDEPLGVLSFRVAANADVLVVHAHETPGVPHEEQRARADEKAARGDSARHYRREQVRHWDHWVTNDAPRFFAYDGDGGQRRPLTPDATTEFLDLDFGLGWDLSPDGATVVTESRRLADDRLYDCGLALIDVESGERRELVSAPGRWFTHPCFSRDGKRVAALDEARPIGEWHRPQLVVLDLADPVSDKERPGAPLTVASDFTGVPGPPRFSHDGDALIATAALAGTQPVVRADIESGAITRLTAEASGGSHVAIDVGERIVVGVRHTLLAAPEPFLVGLEGESEPELLANLSGLEPEETSFARSSLHLTVAGDGSEVPWFLVQPTEAAHASERAPAQLWIHGGPLGQWQDGWHWRWNPLVAVAAGYACALPNPRGSIGLGPDFANQIWNNRWGAECFTDLMSVTDDLVARDDIDGSRVAALGGSFGGYMANWIGTQTDRFGCLVSHAGIYHFPAFYGTTDHPPYWRLQMASDPYSDPEAFVTYSPHRFIDNWKTPVLVIHGELDYRVPISEALLLFDALRDRDVEAELLVFPNENHWILRPHNTRRWYGEILRFIGDHLGSAAVDS